MVSQRILLGLVFAGLAGAASAQGELRWRSGAAPLGLQLTAGDGRAPCGSIAFPCDEGTSTLRLSAGEGAPGSVSLQVGYKQPAPALRVPQARAQALSINVIGRADIVPTLGVYGRVGTTAARAGMGSNPAGEGGLTYGVGLSWDFSRRGSAVLGWDSYDFRTLGGEARDVRATSLGLQWRY